MPISKCPLCNGLFEIQTEWVGQTTVCPHCKQNITISAPAVQPPVPFTGRQKFCPNCGNEIPNGVLYCSVCGNAVSATEGNANPQQDVCGRQASRTTYILLAFFLGGLGIHNFYAGRTACGIAQLLITLLSCGMLGVVSGIWALIEMLTITHDGRGVLMQGKGEQLAVILFVIALLGWLLGLVLNAWNLSRAIEMIMN